MSPSPHHESDLMKKFSVCRVPEGSATSKDKFHCRKRKATTPLRNQLQQILASSQLMEDFLMLFKTACFSNIQALFSICLSKHFSPNALFFFFQIHIFQLYILSSSFYSPSLIHFSFTYLTFHLLDFSLLS